MPSQSSHFIPPGNIGKLYVFSFFGASKMFLTLLVIVSSERFVCNMIQTIKNTQNSAKLTVILITAYAKIF